MQGPNQEITRETILSAISDGRLTLSEFGTAVRDRLNNTLVGDLSQEELSITKRLKTPAKKGETKRVREIEEHIQNTSHFFGLNTPAERHLNNIKVETLQESNGKKYLVLGEDDIFNIIEQRGSVFIAYHPIRKEYIVYRFHGEDHPENKYLMPKTGMISIEKTHIEGYYKTAFFIDGVGYYYISDDGVDTRYFGDYQYLGKIEKHGNTVLMEGLARGGSSNIILHNGGTPVEIPKGFDNVLVTQSGKLLLRVIYNLAQSGTTYSLYDLNTLEHMVDRSDELDIDMIEQIGGVSTIGNRIFWKHFQEREGAWKVLGRKVIRGRIDL